MPGVGNGPGGCPCGALRSEKDPKPLATVEGKEYDGPRLYGNFGPLSDFVVRACAQCGTLYAVARERAPGARARRCGMRPGLNPEGTPCTFEMGHRGECSWDLTL